MKLKAVSIIVIAALLAVTACNAPKPKEEYLHVSGLTQGTYYNIKYKDTVNYKEQVDSLLHVFDLSLSNYDTASQISKLNRDSIFVTDDSLLIALYNKSKAVSELTDGAFDITVAPLANAWRFGFKNDSLLPDSIMIDSLLQYVGMNKVQYTDTAFVKELRGVQFISNAIAQGMSVDYVAAFLQSKGIVDYMVEIGGELCVHGIAPSGGAWKIGVDKPIEDSLVSKRELKAIVSLENRAFATSGNYRKYYMANNKKYSHTIDPRTGYPVRHNLLSASIFADNCGDADALATSCMVIGLEKAKTLIAADSSLAAYFIYEEGGLVKTWMSDEVKTLIEEE